MDRYGTEINFLAIRLNSNWITNQFYQNFISRCLQYAYARKSLRSQEKKWQVSVRFQLNFPMCKNNAMFTITTIVTYEDFYYACI